MIVLKLLNYLKRKFLSVVFAKNNSLNNKFFMIKLTVNTDIYHDFLLKNSLYLNVSFKGCNHEKDINSYRFF